MDSDRPSRTAPAALAMRRTITRAPLGLVACAALLAAAPPAPAWAANGVLEINQTCATSTGCFAGDTPGFPVRIDGAPASSFLLTSDLVLPNGNAEGIFVLDGDVTIDLNGFRIVRADCATTPTCPISPGSGIGVRIPSGERATVRNGSIIGVGDSGIFANRDSAIVDVHVRSCGGSGLFLNGIGGSVVGSSFRDNRGDGIAGGGMSVRESVALDNGASGFSIGGGSVAIGNISRGNAIDGITASGRSTIVDNSVGSNGSAGIRMASNGRAHGNASANNGSSGFVVGVGSALIGNTATGNTGAGFEAGDGSTIQDNTAHLNTGKGFEVGAGATLRGNTATQNTSSGFEAGDGSTFEGNTARSNGATGFFLALGTTVRSSNSSDNTGDGIFVSSGSTVSDNTVYGNGGDGIQAGTDSLVFRNASRLNGGWGLNLSDGTGFRENVVNDNTTGTVTGGIDLSDNVCDANTICP